MRENHGTSTQDRSAAPSFDHASRGVDISPDVLRRAAEAFRGLERADAAWLAVRESCAHTAVVRCTAGVHEGAGLGLRLEPGVGAGGTVLLTGQPWCGETRRRRDDLSSGERELLAEPDATTLLVVPLLDTALGTGAPRVDGLAYVATRDPRGFPEGTVAEATQLGATLGRAVRDAQRLDEARQRWKSLETAPQAGTPDDHLDAVAHQVAADTRVLLRSGIGIVFRLDPTSGDLHSLGVNGADLPELRRGQVLPAGCGSAGRAVTTRAPFVANDYAAGTVQVPPIMSAAVPGWVQFATLSVPLIVGHQVIGALTVARASTMPYGPEDVHLAEQAVADAAPILARAQEASEAARRQQGASELSRLAASLTQDLSIGAVCERLMGSVLSLVRGIGAVVWDGHGTRVASAPDPSGVFQDPADLRLRRLLQQVESTQRPFWTPDLGNDPRLAGPDSDHPVAPGAHGAVLAVPIRVRDKILATLAVSSHTGHSFSRTDVELVQGLADQAALAMATVQAFHDLQFSRAALLRHEKLVATGRLAASLAHELRNPLQNVLGFVAELRERASAPALRAVGEFADFPDYLGLAQRELRRASNIIDRLLDHVRERKPSLESVDMGRIVADALALVTAMDATVGSRIRVDSGEAPLRVQGDPVMLTQVVLNLLTNALDATEGVGQIHVGLRLTRPATSPGRVVVSVRDSGRGIAPEDLNNVFDLFYTTKEIGKGVGLGLAVCQAMIEQHGGTIQVASPGPGQGTTAVFDLPAEP